MMPAKIGDIISWADVFVLRSQLDSDQPMHVQVQEVGVGVSHVRQRDELFLHDIKTDEISLKRYDTSMLVQESDGRERKLSNPQDWTSSDLDHDIEIVLPLQYSERFILYPRYPLSHVFQSVQEILDALPAVSKLIYPIEGFRSLGQSVRPMERLEIIDQIQDPSTGSEMLCVRSMKTEERVLLYADLKISFIQLSNECYKCTSAGLNASEIAMAWKAGQAAFKVKLHIPRTDRETPNELKLPKLKKDKKTKKHRSCDLEDIEISDLSSQREDRWLIPRDWWSKMLLLKPYQKIRVKNIMFESRDFTLPESAKLTVRLLSANSFSAPASETAATESTDRRLSGVEILSGFLRDLPIELFKNSKEPLLLMVTTGSMSVSLRQQVKISQGCRLAVHGTKQSLKLLMTCSKAQKFLVSLTYAGMFRRQPDAKVDCGVKSLLHDVLPRDVVITKQDNRLGYDQLAKRTNLTVTEILQETTLCVELVSASGQKVSEQPFEIPLKRTNLFVQVIANTSSIRKVSHTESMKHLPAVEFVSEEDVKALRKNKKINVDDLVDPDLQTETMHSPEFPLVPDSSNVFLPPNDYLYASPDKSRKKDTSAISELEIETIPPPRPPKSPNLLRKEQQQQTTAFSAPQRPPKPERFKESNEPHFYFSNVNNNNNIVNKEENLPFAKKTVQDKRSGFRQALEKNPQFLTWDPDIKERTVKNPKLKRSKPLVPVRTNICSQRGVLASEETKPLGPESKPNPFIKLHNMYNPFHVIGKQKLVIIDEDDVKRENKHPVSEVDMYMDSRSYRTPTDNKGILRELKKVMKSPNKLKHGKTMSNPNYGDKYEFENVPEVVDKVSQKEENLYEFAVDLPKPRKSLSSLVDDLSDYEEPPPRVEKTPISRASENEYDCAWDDSRKLTKSRLSAYHSYEEPNYDALK